VVDARLEDAPSRAGTTEAPAPVSSGGAGAGVELRGVVKRYGSHLALSELDLSIRDGEFFCLLGPSGCGKTTTLNLIGGFVAPTAGTIWLNGRRIDTLPPHRRPVNTVFQSYALFPHMTVLQNVGFGLRMDKIAKRDAARRAEEALALVGLEAFGDRSPAQLSGGQQQRVAVARALVKRPSVLLLDEPLGALDLKLRQRLQLELAQIHHEVGTTFVYVTHDQEEAMTMADRIAVLDQGRIEQLGTPQEIYRRPASRFVADFIGHANFLDVTVDGDSATVADGTKVPCAGGRPAGPATLMLRPEALRLSDPGAAPPGALVGRTVQSAFLGAQVRVNVASDSAGTSLDITIQGHDVTTIPAPGTEVAIVWDPADGLLLEPAPGRGEE
jgi:spermidine/putrescine transport system ATP-binding protein